MKKNIIFVALAVALAGGLAAIAEDNENGATSKYHYDGCLPVREGCEALVLTNMTIATLADCTFKATMCGAWVNEGKPKVVRGYNLDYHEGERLSVQFQCSD